MTGMDKVIWAKEMEWEEPVEDSESMKETYVVDFHMVSVDKSGEMEIGTSETSMKDKYLAMENITRWLFIEPSKVIG